MDSTSTLVETLTDQFNGEEEKDALATSLRLRDDCMRLAERLGEAEPPALTKKEYALALVGTSLVTYHINNQKKTLGAVTDFYENKLIPALSKIVDEAADDAAAEAMAMDLFQEIKN